jgi:hypothetical protein
VLHANAARLAAYHGAPHLASALSAVASDDARHAAGFALVVGALFEADPEGALLSLSSVVTRGVPLRGGAMDDGWHNGGNPHHASLPLAAAADAGGSSSSIDSGGSSGSRGGSGSGGGQGTGLFRDWAAVVDASGVFTVGDYAAGLEEAFAAWNVSGAGTGRGCGG